MKILIYLEQFKKFEKMLSQFQLNPIFERRSYIASKLGIEFKKFFYKKNQDITLSIIIIEKICKNKIKNFSNRSSIWLKDPFIINMFKLSKELNLERISLIN